MMLSKNFSKQELECKCGCGMLPTQDAINMLQVLRDRIGKPLIITSAARCAKHNQAIKGSKNSQHVQGLAFDIHCVSSTERHNLIVQALPLFNGIGIDDSFIHVDLRKDKKLIFLY